MDRTWWDDIPNARRFIEDIASRAEKGESTAYMINSSFPWKDTFYSRLSEKLENTGKIVEYIEPEELCGKSPGEYIKERYCKPELKKQYRTSIGYEKFLAMNDWQTILPELFIIIKCKDEGNFLNWCSFISGYKDNHPADSAMCCFIIENDTGKEIKSSIHVISSGDYFRRYDIDMFAMLVTSAVKNETRESTVIKKYSAELASLLAGGDIELAGVLASYGTRLAFHTSKVIKEMKAEQLRSDNTEFCVTSNREKKIREAQIRVFYPEIENFRNYIIEKYYDSFPDISNLDYDFEDIKFLELGNIKYLCDTGRMNLDEPDYRLVAFYRECRNKLAHTALLSEEEMRKLSQHIYR